MRDERSIKRARVMRKELTSAEETLWAMLRSRRYRAAKFRRQHAIGPYVVDFACIAARLVIEVDGPSHTPMPSKPRSTLSAPPISNAGAGAWCASAMPKCSPPVMASTTL